MERDREDREGDAKLPLHKTGGYASIVMNGVRRQLLPIIPNRTHPSVLTSSVIFTVLLLPDGRLYLDLLEKKV